MMPKISKNDKVALDRLRRTKGFLYEPANYPKTWRESFKVRKVICDAVGCGKDAAFAINMFQDRIDEIIPDVEEDWAEELWSEADDGYEVCSSQHAEELFTSLILRAKAGKPKPKPRSRRK